MRWWTAGLAALGLWFTAGYAMHHPESVAAACGQIFAHI